MIETIRRMTRSEAHAFLQAAFDCAVPGELKAFADTLPEPVDADDDTLATLQQQRAAIWSRIRKVWSREHRWDTHWEQTRLRKAGLRGAIGIWKEKRRRTSALLQELAALKSVSAHREAA